MQTNHEHSAWQEPLTDQAIESLTDGNPPSVSYVRRFFGRIAVRTIPGGECTILSTGDLFSLELTASGGVELGPSGHLRNLESPDSMADVRPISALAYRPRRDSPNNWPDRDIGQPPTRDVPARGADQP